MRAARVLCLLLAACGDGGTTPGADAGGDTMPSRGWTTGAPVVHGPIQETAAVAVAGKIYVIGGLNSTEGVVTRVMVYDTQADTWSDGPALPRPMHHVNAATDGTTIYVLGALDAAALADTYSFAPGTDTEWQTRASMPAGRERGAAVAGVIDGKLYVAGGLRNGVATDLVDVFDPADDSWMPLEPLPAARDHACGGTLDGQLVVAGGRAGAVPRADVWSYAPGLNTWTPRAAMPTARAGMGCGIIDEELYTTGGEGNPAVSSGMFSNVESYALGGDRWLEHDAMPSPKHGAAGATWDGALYLAGGGDRQGLAAIGTTAVFRP